MSGLHTVLYFQSEGLGELASRLTVQPVDCTHKGGVLRECELTRYAHLDEESALLQTSWQGSLGNVELQPIACPVEGLGLVGDQDTGFCNHVHPFQVACEECKNWTKAACKQLDSIVAGP